MRAVGRPWQGALLLKWLHLVQTLWKCWLSAGQGGHFTWGERDRGGGNGPFHYGCCWIPANPTDCRDMFIVRSRSSLSSLANLCVTTHFCFCPGASGRGCFPSTLPLGLSPASRNTTPGPQLFPNSSSLHVCCSSLSLHRRTPSSRAFRPSYSFSDLLSIAFFELSCSWV